MAQLRVGDRAYKNRRHKGLLNTWVIHFGIESSATYDYATNLDLLIMVEVKDFDHRLASCNIYVAIFAINEVTV